MKFSFQVRNADRARFSVQKLRGKYSDAVARVVYDAPYASYVHENLETVHPNGQAKYVEAAYRELKRRVAQVVRSTLRRTKSMRSAVRAAAELVFNRSQELVPVKTGRLKASGRVEVK